jgi:hypothetical protein
MQKGKDLEDLETDNTRRRPGTGPGWAQVRTMCGLRTGGWSLPCVMSDLQCCVD